jgi:methionyl-tRNA formyltransferase
MSSPSAPKECPPRRFSGPRSIIVDTCEPFVSSDTFDSQQSRQAAERVVMHMSILYVSSMETGKECLRLIKDRIVIDCVVTVDRPLAEKAKVSGYADFGDVGIPLRLVEQYSMKSERDVQTIAALTPQLIIVNGWNRLLPKAILELPRRGCVGIHGSWKPLPFGRGRSPITWAILNGAKRFFVYLLHLDEGADSGDVIDCVEFGLTPHDTSTTVLGKLGIMSARLLLDNVPQILSGTASRSPQTGEPTYLPKRTAEGGRIDWQMSVDEICTLVRAVGRPYPGAFTEIEYRGQRVKMVIWDAIPFAYDIDLEGDVGAVVYELEGKPLIKCRDGILAVKELTVAARL